MKLKIVYIICLLFTNIIVFSHAKERMNQSNYKLIITTKDTIIDSRECVIKEKSSRGLCTYCGNDTNAYQVIFKNICKREVDIKICLIHNDSTPCNCREKYDLAVGDTISVYACNATGQYLKYLKYSDESAAFPSDDEIDFVYKNNYFGTKKNKVYINVDSIDSNNKNNRTYKIGNVYIFDYEIIENGKTNKLDINDGATMAYKLVPSDNDSINIDKIHLIITDYRLPDEPNEPQTTIFYFQTPSFVSTSATFVTDNDSNIWIHPVGVGLFISLRTCPFPYIKKPIKIGREWNWSLSLPETMGDEKWGLWNDWLFVISHYKIIGKTEIQTNLGNIECFIIESYGDSKIGKTKLISYFSEKFGFVRLEYTLLTNIKVNFWLIDFKEKQIFKEPHDLFIGKGYLKND